MAHFFIDRPIFAWVIAIIIMLAGVLAIRMLPVSQYPAIAPPAISINATYPGASAKTVEDTVTQIIERTANARDDCRWRDERLTGRERFHPVTELTVSQTTRKTQLIVTAIGFHLP